MRSWLTFCRHEEQADLAEQADQAVTAEEHDEFLRPSEQPVQSARSTETVCSSQSALSALSEQGVTVLRDYEEKIRAAKKAEKLLEKEREQRGQQSSRKEARNCENTALKDRRQAMLDAKQQGLFDQGADWELERGTQLGHELGHELGRVRARSSTVEEVCRLQTDW